MSDKHLRIIDEVTGIEYDPLKPAHGIDLETLAYSTSKPTQLNDLLLYTVKRGMKAPLPDQMLAFKPHPWQQKVIDQIKSLPEITLMSYDYANGYGFFGVTRASQSRLNPIDETWDQLLLEKSIASRRLSVFDLPYGAVKNKKVVIDSLAQLYDPDKWPRFMDPEVSMYWSIQYDCDPKLPPFLHKRVISAINNHYGVYHG
jgi:hypothetical protein